MAGSYVLLFFKFNLYLKLKQKQCEEYFSARIIYKSIFFEKFIKSKISTFFVNDKSVSGIFLLYKSKELLFAIEYNLKIKR